VIGAITAGLFSAGTPPVTSSYESIATTTVGSGGSSSISFSSIPSTYKHLQIRCLTRGTRVNTFDNLRTQFNSDTTGANYVYYHLLYGDGASAGAAASASGTIPYVLNGTMPAASASASIFGTAVIDILDYQNTNKNKTVKTLYGTDLNGSGEVGLISGLYISTSAISNILIYTQNGNLSQYSSFALYGIKG
jgi:hypothetical protein